MKKIIAIALVIFMMAAMAVPAFAEEGESTISTKSTTLKDDEATVGGTKITYGASQAYTVTIPVTISLDGGSAEAGISISNYSLSKKKVLNIYINSSMAEANYTNKTDEKWYLFEDGTETGATDVEYQVYVKGKNEAPNTLIPRNGTTVIISANTVENANDVTETLVFTTAGTSQVASFTDTISFTAKIEDPKQA